MSEWYEQPARTVAMVIQDTASAKVTYRGEDGKEVQRHASSEAESDRFYGEAAGGQANRTNHLD
jgi:hypothetical protein